VTVVCVLLMTGIVKKSWTAKEKYSAAPRFELYSVLYILPLFFVFKRSIPLFVATCRSSCKYQVSIGATLEWKNCSLWWQKCVRSMLQCFSLHYSRRFGSVLDGISVCALVSHLLLCKGQHNNIVPIVLIQDHFMHAIMQRYHLCLPVCAYRDRPARNHRWGGQAFSCPWECILVTCRHVMLATHKFCLDSGSANV
jgi:hypothetical protein